MPDFLIHLPGQPACSLNRGRPEVRIGRAPDQDIVLVDPAISRRHARIVWRSGDAFLEDLGSRHGCFLNGARIRGLCRIHPGDKIRLGLIELNLEPVQASPPVSVKRASEEETVTLSLPVHHLHGWAEGDGPRPELQAGSRAMDILHGLSLDMVCPCSPQELLTDLLDRVYSFLDASQGAVFLKLPEGGLTELATRQKEDSLATSIRLSEDTLVALFERKEALLLDAAARPSRGSVALPGENTTRSIMAVPLEYQGEVLGLLYFDASKLRGPFTANEIRFVAALSNLAAAKIVHQRTSDELRRKADLERKLLSLESTARAKGELLAFMSHEIRSPLMAMLSYLELAQTKNLPGDARQHLQKADRSGKTLLGILNDVLDFSKLEAGRMKQERIPFHLSEVLEAVMEMFEPQAAAKGLRLRQQVAPGVGEELFGDPLHLGQILINLVGNAVKFTQEGQVLLEVESSADPEGHALTRFSVRDTGIGISPDQQPLLFHPYTQADAATTRRFGGTGLGLFISHRLVKLQGGDLQVQSQPGQGTTFSFSLDLRTQPSATPEIPPDVAPLPERGRGPAERPRILVVEDNPVLQTLAFEWLRGAHFEPQIAGNGAEALDWIGRLAFDAVLLDLELPGMDGWEVARRIRGAAGLGSLPIIALTGYGDPSIQDRCRAAGMNACFTKPVSPDFILQELNRWIPVEDRTREFFIPFPPDGESFSALTAVLDSNKVLKLLAGDRSLFKELLRIFLDTHKGTVDAIGESVSRGAWEEARREAHGLRGAAGTLAMDQLVQAILALEQELDGKPPQAGRALIEARTTLAEALECIQGFLSQPDQAESMESIS
jgi:signal transduction histidine kinase/CheY-like chemotaxis protein/HPt (histidine-containing phosphotransfer) domain-containing protein